MYTIHRNGRVLVRCVDAEAALDAIGSLDRGTVTIQGAGRMSVSEAIRFLTGELAFA
jgi:hypothetical protein